MANNKGYKIPAPLTTLNGVQEYPVADMKDIAGGYHAVKTLSEMFSIPRLHRRVGMICYVINDDDEYRLVIDSSTNKTSLANWMKVHYPEGGQASPGGGYVDLSNYVTKAMFEPFQNTVNSLPDASMIATKTDLQITKNNINNYINQALANVAYKIDIPDVSNFITINEVYAAIDEKNSDDNVTQDEINSLFNPI